MLQLLPMTPQWRLNLKEIGSTSTSLSFAKSLITRLLTTYSTTQYLLNHPWTS
jgi:hypothetical protein